MTLPLSARAGRRGRIITILLPVSLCFNIAALIAPFIRVHIFLKSEMIYSLPHSVLLMWDSKLYLVALLILGFSIIFPFVKLAILSNIWFSRGPLGPRRVILRRVKALGKWSLLDVFVVCIILVLTNEQLFISSSSEYGLYFFLVAIILSLVASMLIDSIARSLVPGSSRTTRDRSLRLSSISGWHYWGVPLFLALSLGTLIFAIGFPFLRISEFLLTNRSYGIVQSVAALWERDIILAVFILFSLIVCPVLYWLGLVGLWFGKFTRPARYRWERFTDRISKLSMLDVFLLALLVFLIEGDSLIDTEIQSGLFLLIVAIVITSTLSAFVNRFRRRLLLREKVIPEDEI